MQTQNLQLCVVGSLEKEVGTGVCVWASSRCSGTWRCWQMCRQNYIGCNTWKRVDIATSCTRRMIAVMTGGWLAVMTFNSASSTYVQRKQVYCLLTRGYHSVCWVGMSIVCVESTVPIPYPSAIFILEGTNRLSNTLDHSVYHTTCTTL